MSGKLMDGVIALVSPHDRPRLASRTVRQIERNEGLAPDQIVVGINGAPEPHKGLEPCCTLISFGGTFGPAGGYARLFVHALERTSSPFLYLCENDAWLLSLPYPRLPDLTDSLDRLRAADVSIAGIAAYATTVNWQTGATVLHRPRSDSGFAVTDMAARGATFINRSLIEAGVSADETLFFGYENFDLWPSARASGYQLLVDQTTEAVVLDEVTTARRRAMFASGRADNAADALRRYYEARNFLLLDRKYEFRSWVPPHLARSARRFRASTSYEALAAVLSVLAAGFKGNAGIVPHYQRSGGELD